MDPRDDGSAGAGAKTIGFQEFILSIATNAIVHLGGEEADGRVPSAADIASASQHIDLLGMLKEKTAGNLDASEEELLDSLLFDLRMRYVEIEKTRAQRP